MQGVPKKLLVLAVAMMVSSNREKRKGGEVRAGVVRKVRGGGEGVFGGGMAGEERCWEVEWERGDADSHSSTRRHAR